MFVSELGGSTSEDVEFSWLKTRLGGHQFLGRIAISLIYLFESILIYLFYLDIFLISCLTLSAILRRHVAPQLSRFRLAQNIGMSWLSCPSKRRQLSAQNWSATRTSKVCQAGARQVVLYWC